MNHTKEPWQVGGTVTGPRAAAIVYWDTAGVKSRYISSGRRAIAFIPYGEGDPDADAERIVACVNMCEGFTTEQIKKDILGELLLALDEIGNLPDHTPMSSVREMVRSTWKQVVGRPWQSLEEFYRQRSNS